MRKRANGFDVGKRKLMFRGVESRSRRRSIRLLRVVVHAPHLFPEFGRQHPDRSFESRGKCFRRCEPQLVGERLYLYVVIGFREDVAGFVDAARVDVLRKRHSAVLVDRSRQIGAVRFESVGDLIDGDIGSPIDFFRSHQFLEFRKQRLPLFVRKRGDGIFPASLRLAVQLLDRFFFLNKFVLLSDDLPVALIFTTVGDEQRSEQSDENRYGENRDVQFLSFTQQV